MSVKHIAGSLLALVLLLGSLPLTTFAAENTPSEEASAASIVNEAAQAKAISGPELSVSNRSSDGVTKLSWDSIEDAQSYQVYRATSKSGKYTRLSTTTKKYYYHSSATLGKTYYYKVRAVLENDAKTSYSNIVSSCRNLERPVVTLGNSASSGKITVSWNAVEGAVKYKVYRATSKSGTYKVILTTDKTSMTNTSTTAGKTYYYKVKAIAENEQANSDFSSVKSRTCDLARPSITLTNTSTGKIKATWKAIDGAKEYKVYRATSKDGTYKLMKTTTGTTYTNTTAKGGNVYYYKVKAIASNSSANSAYSTVKSRTCDLTQPVLSISTVASSGRVQLSWTSVDNAIKYWVYRSTSKNGTYDCIKTLTETTFIDTTATADTTYYYKVRAVSSNSSAHSPYSATKSGTYKRLSTLTLSIELNDEGKPKLSWNEVNNAAKYTVYRAFSKNGKYELQYTTTQTRYSNTGAASGVTYFYKVKAVDSAGKTVSESSTVSVTVALPDGEVLQTRYTSGPYTTLYKLPASSSESLMIPYMAEVKLGMAASTSTSGQWYRVFYKNQLYYLWVTENEQKLTSKRSTFEYKGNTTYQQEVIDLAMYIWENWTTYYAHGQSNGVPNEDGHYGFDCSGFSSYVLNTVMQKYAPAYKLTPVIGDLVVMDDICNKGYKGELTATEVSLANIQPGDIVFFSLEAKNDHCGIYLGNNEFMHSNATWDNSVNLSVLEGIFREKISTIRRYLPKTVTAANAAETIQSGCKLYSNMSYDAIDTIKRGTALTVLFTNSDEWAYVRLEDGREGYVLTRFFA